jgi:hypothetical protein
LGVIYAYFQRRQEATIPENATRDCETSMVICPELQMTHV